MLHTVGGDYSANKGDGMTTNGLAQWAIEDEKARAGLFALISDLESKRVTREELGTLISELSGGIENV